MKFPEEKLPLTANTSFVARTCRTPAFNTSWHRHEAYELILFTEGEGLAHAGNYTGRFIPGDVFLLGPWLPHSFQSRQPEQVISAVIVHFPKDLCGDSFLQLPESSAVLRLLKTAAFGLQVSGSAQNNITPLIKRLEWDTGFKRLLTLGECLATLENSAEYTSLSTHAAQNPPPADKTRIDTVCNYAMNNYLAPIDLSVVADLAGLTVSAFCTYFKKKKQTTYVSFVNQIRIEHACKLITTTENSITAISYESGYSSIAHFNKTFYKIKGVTPSEYRKGVKKEEA